MTLTEEQREAIRAVSDLPRAIGCTQCHSYIQEHYGNQFAILRAMIDSGEHFTDASKMSGFDMERARGLRDFLQDDCAEVGDVWGEMIAEIERLRGFETAARDLSNDLTRVAKERDELQEANTNFAFQASDQAQEIERLRAEISEQKGMIWKTQRVEKEQAARIKELEDAHKRSGKKYAKIINELRSSVYANIPGLKKQWDEVLAEGKIGSGGGA